METKRFEYKCLKCGGVTLYIEESKCNDGLPCPVCWGPIRATGVETITKYADGEQIKEPPLLTIELQDESSVPKVFYQGEEVTNKVRVSFDWETDTDEPGGTLYNVEHFEMDSIGVPTRKGYGLARGKYALD